MDHERDLVIVVGYNPSHQEFLPRNLPNLYSLEEAFLLVDILQETPADQIDDVRLFISKGEFLDSPSEVCAQDHLP